MYMNYKKNSNTDIDDNLFASLKNDYEGIKDWFTRKNNEGAFVEYDEDGNVEGFLYLKIQNNFVDDVTPKIVADKILKVVTFKINPYGTQLGERFIKVITDYAVSNNVDVCYVTIFAEHESLIQLVEEYGFVKHGLKGAGDNLEVILTKDMRKSKHDIYLDYPLINKNKGKKYVLGIYPKDHSMMFPEPISRTEDKAVLEDVPYTNSVNKIHVCSMYTAKQFKKGDIVVVYRTGEEEKFDEFSAVATSICVVDEIKLQDEFKTFDKFYDYASLYNALDKDDLNEDYNNGNLVAIKMTYNVALEKRITRHNLIEKAGLNRFADWGCFEISDSEFEEILKLGNVNENFFVE